MTPEQVRAASNIELTLAILGNEDGRLTGDDKLDLYDTLLMQLEWLHNVTDAARWALEIELETLNAVAA